LVLLEAFRSKTPVLARRLGGPADVIGESGGGMTYGSDDELAAGLRRLLNEPALRNDLGKSGFDAYHRQWTPDAHLTRYFALIDEVQADRA
jgi:glycosyltransferase involved in cell wall biosynthesis